MGGLAIFEYKLPHLISTLLLDTVVPLRRTGKRDYRKLSVIKKSVKIKVSSALSAQMLLLQTRMYKNRLIRLRALFYLSSMKHIISVQKVYLSFWMIDLHTA